MSKDVKPVADAPVAPAVEPVVVEPVVETDEVEDAEDESECGVKWEDGRPIFPENADESEEE